MTVKQWGQALWISVSYQPLLSRQCAETPHGLFDDVRLVHVWLLVRDALPVLLQPQLEARLWPGWAHLGGQVTPDPVCFKRWQFRTCGRTSCSPCLPLERSGAEPRPVSADRRTFLSCWLPLCQTSVTGWTEPKGKENGEIMICKAFVFSPSSSDGRGSSSSSQWSSTGGHYLTFYNV